MPSISSRCNWGPAIMLLGQKQNVYGIVRRAGRDGGSRAVALVAGRAAGIVLLMLLLGDGDVRRHLARVGGDFARGAEPADARGLRNHARGAAAPIGPTWPPSNAIRWSRICGRCGRWGISPLTAAAAGGVVRRTVVALPCGRGPRMHEVRDQRAGSVVVRPVRGVADPVARRVECVEGSAAGRVSGHGRAWGPRCWRCFIRCGCCRNSCKALPEAESGGRRHHGLSRSPVERRPGAWRPNRSFRRRKQLALVNVRLADAAGVRLLDDVSLTIPCGSRTAIIASDRETPFALAGLVPRFYDPAAGRVLFDGQDIGSVTLASLRSQVGLLMPDRILVTGTVSENIACGDSAAFGPRGDRSGAAIAGLRFHPAVAAKFRDGRRRAWLASFRERGAAARAWPACWRIIRPWSLSENRPSDTMTRRRTR